MDWIPLFYLCDILGIELDGLEIIGGDMGLGKMDNGECWSIGLEEEGSKEIGLEIWSEWSGEEELDDLDIGGW